MCATPCACDSVNLLGDDIATTPNDDGTPGPCERRGVRGRTTSPPLASARVTTSVAAGNQQSPSPGVLTRDSLSLRRFAQPLRSEPARPRLAASPLPNVLGLGGRTCCKMSGSVDLFTALVGHDTRTRLAPCSSTVASIFRLTGTRRASRPGVPSSAKKTLRRADHIAPSASSPNLLVRGMTGTATAGRTAVYPAGLTWTSTVDEASAAPSCTATVAPGATVKCSPRCRRCSARGDAREPSGLASASVGPEPTDTETDTGSELVRYRGGARATTDAAALRE